MCSFNTHLPSKGMYVTIAVAVHTMSNAFLDIGVN